MSNKGDGLYQVRGYWFTAGIEFQDGKVFRVADLWRKECPVGLNQTGAMTYFHLNGWTVELIPTGNWEAKS